MMLLGCRYKQQAHQTKRNATTKEKQKVEGEGEEEEWEMKSE